MIKFEVRYSCGKVSRKIRCYHRTAAIPSSTTPSTEFTGFICFLCMDRLIHLLWGINQQRTKNKVNSGNHPRVALFIDLISRKSTLGRVLTNPSEPVELPRLDVQAELIIKTKGVRSRQTFSSGRWIWPFRSRGLVFQKWMFKPLSIRYALRQLDKSDRRDWRKVLELSVATTVALSFLLKRSLWRAGIEFSIPAFSLNWRPAGLWATWLALLILENAYCIVLLKRILQQKRCQQ